MTGPQRPHVSSQGPYNATPFTVPANPGSQPSPSPPSEQGRKFLTWRMLRLVAALVALLAVIVLGIRILFPPPDPINEVPFVPVDIIPSETINREQFNTLLEEGIAKFDAAVASSGGVNAVLTSQLLATNGNSLLQVSFDQAGNHLVSTYDLLAEPTPIRFTRGDNTFINTVTPFPASTIPVAKIRDTEFIGEWSLSDPSDPSATVSSLPELARELGQNVETATVGNSPDGLITQVIINQDGLLKSEVPLGLLKADIEGPVQISYLFDNEKRLVGVSATGESARVGDASAPQIIYAVPVEGFAAVEVPGNPENPGIAPENLPATGPWSNLVALATDIQRTGRKMAADMSGDAPVTGYTAELAAEILDTGSISQQLSATQSTFDPATNVLRDNAGRVVCLPLGTINPGADVATQGPTLYLDLCPVVPQEGTSEQS